MRQGLVQLAYRAGDPPEPPRDIPREEQSGTREYPLIWFPFDDIAGYTFESPNKPKPSGLKMYLDWEEALATGSHLDHPRYEAMRNVLGYVWNCPAPPLILGLAKDGRYYVIRHNRVYCALRIWNRRGLLHQVPCVTHPRLVPVRIAHPEDHWGDATRAALVHPIEQVDRTDGTAKNWLEPTPYLIWPQPAERLWKE